jgi:hypothetical protein
MARPRARRGEIVQSERPNWQPLEALVGERVAGDFMWMFEVELRDGSLLEAYKHIDTRRYIHLNALGEAFVYESPDRYRQASTAQVLNAVFAGLPRLAGVTGEQVRASWDAVDRLLRAAGDEGW